MNHWRWQQAIDRYRWNQIDQYRHDNEPEVYSESRVNITILDESEVIGETYSLGVLGNMLTPTGQSKRPIVVRRLETYFAVFGGYSRVRYSKRRGYTGIKDGRRIRI